MLLLPILLMKIHGMMCQKLVLVFSFRKFFIFFSILSYLDRILLDCARTFANISVIHAVHVPNPQACLKCLTILYFYQSICTFLLQDHDPQKYFSHSLKQDHWYKQVYLKIWKWIQKEYSRLLMKIESK